MVLIFIQKAQSMHCILFLTQVLIIWEEYVIQIEIFMLNYLALHKIINKS